MNVDDLVRREIREFKAFLYPVAEENALRMDANTNLIGVNPVLERVAREVLSLELNHYPTPFSDELREAISKYYRVPFENIIVGDGSDEVIDFISKAFLNPGDIVGLVSPSFVMQRFYARVNLGRPVEIPLRPGEFRLDVDALLRLRAKMIMIASPNNPTANAFDSGDLKRLIGEFKGILVIDEAYAEFCRQNFFESAPRYPNVIVLRTFSKAHGLAGLRVGYACAHASVIERLHSVKPPFTVGRIPERAAVEALRDPSFMEETVRMMAQERQRLADDVRGLGATPFPSDANFMMMDLQRPADPVREELKKNGVLVRGMSDFRGYESCLRVTIGRPEHNRRFLDVLKEALGRA